MGVSLSLGQSGQKLFLAADKRRAHWAVTAVVEGKGAVRFFFSYKFLFLSVVKEQKSSGGNSPSMVYPLMSWCAYGSGWILSC